MRIVNIALAGCALLGILLPAAAWAQYEEEGTASKINLRLGLTRLLGSDEKRITSKSWYTEEIIYDYKQDDTGRTLGQIGLGLSEPSGGSSASILFATVNKLWWKDAKNGKAFFGGAGIGAYKIKLFGDTELKPGAQVFGGYNFTEEYFAELRLTAMPSSFGNLVNFSSLTLSVGTRRLF